MAKQIGWNSVAPLADSSGKVLPGTAIKAGQEVIYSKVIRKMMKFDRKSWMELVMFSLVTSATDIGTGSWYGAAKAYKDMGFKDVMMEAVRPILSVVLVNYIFNVSYTGFHNPMKSFSFMDFLISLVAKDLAVGGNSVLARQDFSKDHIAVLDNLQARMQAAARFQPKK